MKENNALKHFVVYLLNILVNLFNSPTKLKLSLYLRGTKNPHL